MGEVGYVGVTTAFDKAVFVDGERGLQTLRLAGSALTFGYAWGRAGSGPREVARAILIDATGNEMLAERLCRPFTWEVVAKLPSDGFRITRREVLAWVEGEGPPDSATCHPCNPESRHRNGEGGIRTHEAG